MPTRYADMGENGYGFISGIWCFCGLEVQDIMEHYRTAHPAPEIERPARHQPQQDGGVYYRYTAPRRKITADELRAIGRRSQGQVL